MAQNPDPPAAPPAPPAPPATPAAPGTAAKAEVESLTKRLHVRIGFLSAVRQLIVDDVDNGDYESEFVHPLLRTEERIRKDCGILHRKIAAAKKAAQ